MSKNFADKPYAPVTPVYHRMVLRAPSQLPPATIAELAGYTNYNTMMSELSGQPGHKLGVDKQLALMDACDSDAPLDYLAGERGGVFVRLPKVRANGRSMTLQLAATIKECSEAAAMAAAHIVDGKVTPEEFSSFRKENREAIAALLELEYLMEECMRAGE